MGRAERLGSTDRQRHAVRPDQFLLLSSFSGHFRDRPGCAGRQGKLRYNRFSAGSGLFATNHTLSGKMDLADIVRARCHCAVRRGISQVVFLSRTGPRFRRSTSNRLREHTLLTRAVDPSYRDRSDKPADQTQAGDNRTPCADITDKKPCCARAP